MADRALKVVQVNSTGTGGGAALIARLLHQGLPAERVQSTFLVGSGSGAGAEGLVELAPRREEHPWLRFWTDLQRRFSAPSLPGQLAAQACRAIAAPTALATRLRGHEDFNHPGSHRLLELAGPTPDLLHLHNLHGDYFDLECLPALTRARPTLITLHDAWLLSGHCAHSFDCDRWRSGCGACPDLRIYPALLRDGTAFNWRRKQRILASSWLRIATPSAWLMRRVEESIVAPGMVEGRVIPHGVDLEVFTPGDRAAARRALGLDAAAQLVTCAGYSLKTNRFKDYPTLRAAIAALGARKGAPPLVVLAIGETGPVERFGSAELRFIGRLPGPAALVDYYRASDLYVHPARADTFPGAVLEALACGCPVVASAVGGIPEQVISLPGRERATGMLVSPGSPESLASALSSLLADEGLRAHLGRNAARDARERFDQRRMLAAYLSWYEELVPA